MSYYYKYSFTSPEGIYAIIKEELKSYFDTGAIDDLLFPTYIDKCLKKLGKGTYSITEDMIYLEDFQARLPDNFSAVREAWLCTETNGRSYQSASSFYSQSMSTTIQIAPLTIDGETCGNPDCHNPGCEGECMPEIVQAVYKTNHEIARSFKREYLLKPGNISARKNCDVEYTNEWSAYSQAILSGSIGRGSSSYDSFDIRDNKFVTNIREGAVFLVFYATDYDNEGNQMIPDNYRVKEYIEAFIKYKMFETLTNQTNDETFQQLQQKLVFYKQTSDEAYIMADTELKRPTVYDVQRNIKRSLNRLNMYQLPGTYNTSRRRNN